MREKLIKLLDDFSTPVMLLDTKLMDWKIPTQQLREAVADHLIANGVTIQKEGKLYWKPVGKGTWNLTCSACDSHLGCRENAKYCPECGAKFVKQEPLLPKLPEEEAWEDSKT
jgi:hypothetical protein